MIRVLFVFIGNGVGVRRVVASFNKGCRISHWLDGVGPGESFSRRQYHPRVAARRYPKGRAGWNRGPAGREKIRGGTTKCGREACGWSARIKFGSRSARVPAPRTRAFRIYSSELSDRQPDYWSIRTCLITHGPNGLWPSDSALRCVLPLTRRRIYVALPLCTLSAANALLFFLFFLLYCFSAD